MGVNMNHFFSQVPHFCQDVCTRIGYPLEQVEFHRQFIGNIVRTMPSNGDLSLEKVLELTTMMLGQSLNLASITIRNLLEDVVLFQKCETLKARLLGMSIHDLDSQYDELVQQWIPGPLFSDVKIFCNEVEFALLTKYGKAWADRYFIHHGLR